MANATASNFQILALIGGANSGSGATTLTTESQNFQRIDPAGGAIDVDLPVEADSNGTWFYIENLADAAEAITVKNSSAATVATISQNEAAIVICNGTAWVHMGIITIALT